MTHVVRMAAGLGDRILPRSRAAFYGRGSAA